MIWILDQKKWDGSWSEVSNYCVQFICVDWINDYILEILSRLHTHLQFHNIKYNK